MPPRPYNSRTSNRMSLKLSPFDSAYTITPLYFLAACSVDFCLKLHALTHGVDSSSSSCGFTLVSRVRFRCETMNASHPSARDSSIDRVGTLRRGEGARHARNRTSMSHTPHIGHGGASRGGGTTVVAVDSPTRILLRSNSSPDIAMGRSHEALRPAATSSYRT
jgi:hypothetical protein